MYFEAHRKQDLLLLSVEPKEFHLTLANLVDIFKALNVLNLILQGKTIDLINDCLQRGRVIIASG